MPMKLLMYWTCHTAEILENIIFSKNLKGKGNVGDLGKDGRIILKCISKEYKKKVCLLVGCGYH